MAIKRKALTEEQFRSLNTTDGWSVDEVPKKDWAKIPGLQRRNDTIGIMASGSMTDPRVLNKINAIAGFDVLVNESNPMARKMEPEGNAYHYVIQKIAREDFPYILHGPYRSGMQVSHWFEAPDLVAYFVND